MINRPKMIGQNDPLTQRMINQNDRSKKWSSKM